tara:strand:- start:135 stop:419 length:285 start_codon:yes stop_codon:yes gene_type:complete
VFDWSDEKDAKLRRERGVGFQEVVFHIDRGDVLEVAEHPNQRKYAGQKILFVRIDDYVYLVPCVEAAGKTFLKTIIPSRVATRRLLKGEDDETR